MLPGQDEQVLRPNGRQLRILLAAASVVLVALFVVVEPAMAQETTTTVGGSPGIIPKPNSGVAPTDPGDRGGSLQGLLFFLIVAVVAGIAGLIWRQSRTIRVDRGY